MQLSLGKTKTKVTFEKDYGEFGERHDAGSVVIWCSRSVKMVGLAWPVVRHVSSSECNVGVHIFWRL